MPVFFFEFFRKLFYWTIANGSFLIESYITSYISFFYISLLQQLKQITFFICDS